MNTVIKTSFLLLILFPQVLWALQQQESFSIPSPKKLAEAAEKTPGLKTSNLEIRIKRGLVFQRLTNSAEFFKIKGKTLENPVQYQSYVDEVDEAFWGKNIHLDKKTKADVYKSYMENTNIETARKIAKLILLKAVEKNWFKLKQTIFNEFSVEDKNAAKALTLERMKEDFVFSPVVKSNKYLFKFGDSFVEIAKDLKSGRVALDVDSRLDTNTLSPDAENIIPDDASFSEKKKRQARLEKKSKDTESTPSNSQPNYDSQTPTNTNDPFGDEKL